MKSSRVREGRKNATGVTTVAAVVAYADQLRIRAMRVMNPDSPQHDPYARPYYPTTAAARKLCQRKARELVRALGPDPSSEAVEQAEARGPAAAKEEMAYKAARAERVYREQRERSDLSRKRSVRNQRRAARDREAQLEGLTLGARLDNALAEFAVVGAGPATQFEPRISGSEERAGPGAPGDPAMKARIVARDAVAKVEDELESARRRRLELEDEDAA